MEENTYQHKAGIYEKYIKRFLDILLSGIGIIVLSPVFLIVAILVRVKLGSPVLFKQERPGKNEKIFKMYKFRSMTDERDEKGELLPDSVRLTKFGKWLRSTSLDELPELFNIIKGDMSIVGPRPLAVCYLPYYNQDEKHRHDVTPGLTGLAQINGRTTISWEKRFKYDLQYIYSISFLSDIKIVYKTFSKVFSRQDVVQAGLQGNFDKFRLKEIEEGRQVKREIGSDFWSNPSSDKIFQWEVKGVSEKLKKYFFISGRSALRAIISDLNEKRKIALIPVYDCHTITESFELEGWEIVYYNINRDFSIDTNSVYSLIKQYQPSAIVLQNYYGFETTLHTNEIITYCKDRKITMIEDITQSIFSDFKKMDVDFYFASLRKFIAIPEGGCVWTKKKMDTSKYLDPNYEIYDANINAFSLKQKYMLGDESVDKEQFRSRYAICKDMIEHNNEIIEINKKSLEYVHNLDSETIRKKRNDNCAFLYNNLKDVMEIKLVPLGLSKGITPLYFPMYVENRGDLQKFLSKKNIYCPVIWPSFDKVINHDNESNYIFQHILCIPCDQRYNIEDMNKIVLAIKEFCL